MDVRCGSCGRRFELNGERVGDLSVARCVCGTRVYLHGDQDRLPRNLGKYVLLKRIALGGMGEIYFGKIAGIEGFERGVAIKKMLPHLSQDRAFIDMMVKEAKLTVLLNHPNIVQVYDLAKEGEEYYIAMEYVPGVTVASMLGWAQSGGRSLPVELAVHVVLQVLRGLSYAHDLPGPDGEHICILHRDVTPQNILVTRQAWVKITDFGIARALNEVSTTSPGMIKGKLGYLAPEQLEGQTVDRRVDIFCAGILLWEMLAARRLFKGESEADTLRLIAETRVPPLSDMRQDVPAKLEKVLAEALAHDRDARLATADAFYDALSEAIAPRSVDDFRVGTRNFLADKEDVFAEGAIVAENERTSELLRLDVSDDQLTPIAQLTRRPKPSLAWLQRTLGVLLVLLTGLAGWLYRDVLIGDESGKGASPTPVATPVSGGSEVGIKRLSPEEVQFAIEGERARLLPCYRQDSRLRQRRELRAKLVIASTGGVANAVLELDPSAYGAAGRCIEKVLRGMFFRRHPEPLVEVPVRLPLPQEVSPPPPAKPVPSPPSAPPRLKATEVQATVQRYSASIAKCLEGFPTPNAPAKLDAHITIDTDGRVTAVDLVPAVVHDAVRTCLVDSLRKVRFRRQPVQGFRVTIPLQIQVL